MTDENNNLSILLASGKRSTVNEKKIRMQGEKVSEIIIGIFKLHSVRKIFTILNNTDYIAQKFTSKNQVFQLDANCFEKLNTMIIHSGLFSKI